MIIWFAANMLVVNLGETNIITFITYKSHYALHIGYKEKYIKEIVSTKCLVLPIDNHLNRKNHA
jgi:hypothetical protein